MTLDTSISKCPVLEIFGFQFANWNMPVRYVTLSCNNVPWVPEVFLACGENFRCWPKADTSSAVGRRHERRSREKNYKDLTETGNRARKISGTQGSNNGDVWRNVPSGEERGETDVFTG